MVKLDELVEHDQVQHTQLWQKVHLHGYAKCLVVATSISIWQLVRLHGKWCLAWALMDCLCDLPKVYLPL